MEADLKDEWITRLSDDDTIQGRHVLAAIRSDGKVAYCCWGVLCDILTERGMVERFETVINKDYGYYHYKTVNPDITMSGYPSFELLERVGIDKTAGPSGDIRNYLAGLNDSGSNFQYIANEIREYL